MPNPPRQPHLLLVEDQLEIYQTLQRRLEEHYPVTLATTYEEALQQLLSGHFHLAIFDVRLNAEDENDRGGIQLLKDVESLNLRGIMPCLIITAYGTTALVIQALQNLGADKFIEKRPGYIAELLDAIPEVLGKYKVNFGLEFVFDTPARIKQGANFIHAPEAPDPNWPAAEQLTPQIEDILGRLFYGARQLWIDRIYPGLSGAFVMQAHPTWPNGLGQSVIVKIGRRDKIATESDRYHEHVEHFLPGRHATRLDVAYTRHLGSLLYTFVDTEDKDTVTFADFYRQQHAERVVEALQQLFRQTCRLWYQAHTRPNFELLRDLYLEAFSLSHQPDRLAREIASVLPGYDRYATTMTLSGTLTGEANDPPLTLPNPLYWLADDTKTIMAVCLSITHGDLHADNILMSDAGDCWLIDFYRTYPSHILRDFIELETDIKFRLLDDLAPADFLALEQALITLDYPVHGVDLPSDWPEHACKAAIIIAGLRAEAWHLLESTQHNVRLIQREYLTGLLLGTLNILRLRHYKEDPALQPRRKLALLSAGLICQHLQ